MSETPAVPDDRLRERGFEPRERTTRTRLSLPQVEIREHTVLYADERLRERVRQASGVDRTWRFFFATRLAFTPPLPPGVGPPSVFPMVQSEGRRGFVSDLRERGIENVERVGTERLRVETSQRARLTRYRGRLEDPDGSYGVEGALAVWIHDGQFRLAGGGFPTGLPGVETDPTTYRTDLLEAIRGVE